jgi:hypothetical protein
VKTWLILLSKTNGIASGFGDVGVTSRIGQIAEGHQVVQNWSVAGGAEERG